MLRYIATSENALAENFFDHTYVPPITINFVIREFAKILHRKKNALLYLEICCFFLIVFFVLRSNSEYDTVWSVDNSSYCWDCGPRLPSTSHQDSE